MVWPNGISLRIYLWIYMMTTNSSTGRLIAQAILLALAAAMLQQVVHESTHGLMALAVGMRWEMLNLFASSASWPGEPNLGGEAVVAGSAAVVDIAVALGGFALLRTQALIRRPRWRLLLFYYVAISWLAGFGYLLVDSLFYNPASENVGDWRKVIAFLGGAWSVRLPILLVGLVGTLLSYFWMPAMALRFGEARLERAQRIRIALPLLLIPYFCTSLVLTCLSYWHPMGATGVVLVMMKTWMGYSPFIWSFFIACYWMPFPDGIRQLSTLPAGTSWPWLYWPAGFVLGVVGLLVPTLHF